MADLAFLWHMHQPDYRHPDSGEFLMPWVLLHAAKDYTDMAAHLERHPGIRCTVNFVPVLLDQIEDYAAQFASGQWRDPLLRLVAAPDDAVPTAADRAWLLDVAFRCHAPTMLDPFAPYRRLRDLLTFVRDQDGHSLNYLSATYYADLAVWYLLAWSGESLRRSGRTIPQLMAKGGNFSAAERRALLAELGDAIGGLIPRYRALAERGQIELSCTPANHPLAPLMLDFASAREALPECLLPAAPEYPGGRSRIAEHLASARASHERRFGRPAEGLWPAEGALSAEFLKQIAVAGFQWTASSRGVLRHSAGDAARTTTPWLPPEGTPSDIVLFFRDERLSDLIGFEYAKWHGRDAAQDFISELKAIHQRDPDSLISVFLDGENAWEYYPYNAWYFFSDLYAALEQTPDIRTVTLAEAAAAHREHSPRLPRLTAGSWVYGTLSTWIGHPDKNRAWELLCELKLCADRALDSGRFDAAVCAEVRHRLAVCESSDWFWWLGDDNPAESVATFDRLFRHNLRSLYHLLELPPPAALDHPLSSGGSAAESGGTMRRATETQS
ncbi:glycoside hydrolase family 57 protein [Azonexus sp.]|jgi:alpha-amylase/alpha-mannosidase (GH57 family)|uniref:glycoside hydrolase family 57 protein n=1 Tax=Azonexus sp. TaxID=1872668 RepID=UPI0028249CBE|nr:glycoside hydrolase family 57 protein [Azonexus sp.]MDR1995990.1 glycoside hydrolase [Azonexus sp.]